MSDTKKSVKAFTYSYVSKHTGVVSQFFPEGYFRYKDTHKPALCQLKGCKEPANWIQSLEKSGILICFKHHEQLSHEKRK